MTNKKRSLPEFSIDEPDEKSRDIIQQQLDRIINSPVFEATRTQNEFLRYIVEKVLNGQSDDIKGYTVATEVFGRREDFDQSRDPVVSIHANKLRRALERYYLIVGENDPVRIDIPKGSYVPVFKAQTPEKMDMGPSDIPASMEYEATWPSILILPFKNLTGDIHIDSLCIGFTSELAVEITHSRIIRALLPVDQQRLADKADRCRFLLEGNIQKTDAGFKITYHLTDRKTDRQISGETYHFTYEDYEIHDFLEQVTRVIAVKTSGMYGAIPKTMAIESRHKQALELSTYEAILRYYEFDQIPTPEGFSRALESLTQAAKVDPGCGQIWTGLAHLYAHIHGLDFPGFNNPLEKAVEYAERGARIDPDSQRALAILAFVRFHSNELDSACKDIEQAHRLSPGSLHFMDGLGYIMTLSGMWEPGTELIRRAIRWNPFYRPVSHYPLWLDFIRRQDYHNAYLETLKLKTSEIFWYPLVKAATLGLLGKTKDAEPYLKKLFDLKPDFPTKYRDLIGRYIKFDDLVERVINGLEKAGMDRSV